LSEFQQITHVLQDKNGRQYGKILKIIAGITTITLILLPIAAFSKPDLQKID
jgi:hypothetical protein